MGKVLLILLQLLNPVLNKPLLEAEEDVFDYDLLENYMANATASNLMMTMEELLTRISEVQESRIPKDKLLDLLEDEKDEKENGEYSNSDWDAVVKPPPNPQSPQSKEEAGCIVHYHYHYH